MWSNEKSMKHKHILTDSYMVGMGDIKLLILQLL